MGVTKGMFLDSHEFNQPDETYRWALNWVSETHDSITTELGNDIVDVIYGIAGSPNVRGFLAVGFIPKNEYVVCFFHNQSTNKDEIGVYNEKTNTYNQYITNVELNLKVDRQVRGIIKFNNNGDLVVVANDRFNPPLLITIDIIGYDLTKYYPNFSINQLYLFPKVKYLPLTTNVLSGGNLPVGPYIVFIQYESKNGSTSTCYSNDVVINITSQNNSDYKVGELLANTSRSISVGFTPDLKWYKVNIGLAQLSSNTCKIITSQVLSTQTSINVILSSFVGNTLAGGLDNINVAKTHYDKIHTQTTLNGSLWLGNLTKSQLSVPQSIINTLGVKWVCTWKDANAKLPSNTLKSFQPNEVYALYVRILKDGIYSNWYHIKGRNPSTVKGLFAPFVPASLSVAEINTLPAYGLSETDVVSSLIPYNEFPVGDAQGGRAKNFHYLDSIDYADLTFTTNGDGEQVIKGPMSYWEHETETYNSYYTGDDLNVGASINALNNVKVRHHKFPSKQYLNQCTVKNNYPTLPTGTTGSTTVYPFKDKPDLFITKQPELSVELVLSSEFTTWVTANIGSYDSIEIGNAKRDINNNTVISEDIALFGVYADKARRPDDGGDAANINLPADFKTDALGFTGGNFNSINGATFGLNTSLNQSPDRYNGDFLKEESLLLIERTPNRQRVFTPDMVDDSSVDFLNTNVDYVRHEVLLTACNAYTNGGTLTISRNFYDNVSLGNPLKPLNFQSAFGAKPYDCLGRNFLMLFDYTVNTPTSYGTDTGWKNYAISDFTYPNLATIQNVESNSYILKGQNNGITSGKPINSTSWSGVVYGGNNHLHLKFKSTDSRPVINANHWKNVSTLKVINYNASNTILNGANGLIPSYLFSTINPTVGTGGYNRYSHNTFITTLCKFNPTIYSNFNTLEIELAVENKGDVFISEVEYLVNGFTTYGQGNTNGGNANEDFGGGGINSCMYRYYAHTRKNITRRKKETDTLGIKTGFYPLDSFDSYSFQTSGVLPQGFYLDDEWSIKNINYLYGSVYNSFDKFLSEFPYRILKSSVNSKESSIENWSNFPILDYYEIDKINGVISNLQGYDEILMIQTVDRLLMTKSSNNLKMGTFSVVLGTGDLFDSPLNEVMLDNQSGGYIGTKHQSACLLTPYGYVTYDVDRRRLFLIKQGIGPKEISSDGVRTLFENYGGNQIYDSNLGTTSPLPDDFGVGLNTPSVIYDHRYRRIIIVLPQINKSLSYYPDLEKWVSAHDYIPVLAFNTKQNVYGSLLTDTSKLIKLNGKNTFNNFTNARNISLIDVCNNSIIVNTPSGPKKGLMNALKLIESVSWQSEVRDYDDFDKVDKYEVKELETFTSIQMRTNKQSSEEIQIKPYVDYGDITQNTRKYKAEWNFNRFRDTTLRNNDGNPTLPIVNPVWRGNGYDISNSFLSTNTKRFVDTFMISRLKFVSNSDNKRLTLLNTDWNAKIVTK